MSVVMAVRDGLPYLGATISSILAQTLDDLELVVVDDASSDGSGQVVGSFDDARIRLLTNPRSAGLAASLNRGIAASTAEYIARIDADDLADARRLERQVAFLDANPDVALVGSWYETIGPHGEHLGYHPLPCSPQEVRWAMRFYCPFVHSAVVIRRRCLDEFGGYDPSIVYSEDYALWRAMAASVDLVNLPQYLTSFRVGHGSMTTTYGDLALEGERMACAALSDQLGWERLRDDEALARLQQMRLLAFGGDGAMGSGAFVAARDVVRTRRLFAADETHRGQPPPGLARFRARLLLRALRLGVAQARRGDGDGVRAAALAAAGSLVA